jgi:tRNA (cmo5U34)-methyltransferase
MRDNTTSQPAGEYDAGISKTMPHYELFHENTIGLIEVVRPNPARWLDTGCGTGTLASKAMERFAQTRFVLADPSPAMLDLAKAKMAGCECEFHLGSTEELGLTAASLEVVTAILSHHYYPSPEGKLLAVENCFRMLKTSGIYVTFESFLPASEPGVEIALKCWRSAQLARGKKEADVEKYLKRFGVEFFPMPLDAHVRMLRETGFSVVEVFWLSGMQAGIYAIK